MIIDGSSHGLNEYFIRSAFAPGGRANTGIRPTTDKKPPTFLRDTTPEALRAYAAIYLADVERLDNRAIDNLEAYVKDGGGLAMFLGDNVNFSHYNDKLFKDGKGLLPAPLQRSGLLIPPLELETPRSTVNWPGSVPASAALGSLAITETSDVSMTRTAALISEVSP